MSKDVAIDILKVGIISDIHGNYTALESVIDELRSEKVRKMICLGDVVEGGPQPKQVLQKLKDLDMPVVAGNADEEVLYAKSIRNYQNDFERKLHDIDRWSLDQLSSSDIAFLRTFKPSIEESLSKERRLYCYHGSPRSNREGILPTTPESDLADIFSKAVRAHIIACGHTHSQMFRTYLESVIINPGSVGMPFRYATMEEFRNRSAHNPAYAEYAILNYLDNGSLNIELRRVPVNLEKIIASLMKSGMPHAEYFSRDWRYA